MKSLNDRLAWQGFLDHEVSIRCDTKEEYNKLMCICEGSRLYWGWNAKPTSIDHFVAGRTFAVHGDHLAYCSNIECSNGEIKSAYCPDPCPHRNNVPFSALDIPAPSIRKIIITTDGRVTTARLIEGKKTVKTATATCSPEDEFNFEYGAALACSRLTLKPEWAEWYAEKAAVLDDLSAWLKEAAGK